MNFEQVPKEISIDEVINNAYSLSPLMYKKVQIKNRNVRKIFGKMQRGNIHKF